MAHPIDRLRGTYDPTTAVITVILPSSFWQELPSNSDDFAQITVEEEGALRSLLAAIWIAGVPEPDSEQL